MKEYDIVVIGGGISGMTSVLIPIINEEYSILIIEREGSLGGILNQCISNRYGKRLIGANLTGPEYVYLVETLIKKPVLEVKLNTEVLSVSDNKEIKYVNSSEGVNTIKAKAIVLATGCREKHIGSVAIPLNKYTSVYTVGSTQKIVKKEGHLPGKNPVVVANSNWALSITRRLVIEGAKVRALLIDNENGFIINDYYNEIMQELGVPVYLKSKIIDIYGEKRIEGVKIFSELQKTQSLISCDTLILSLPYLPEVSVIKDTLIEMEEDTLVPKLNEYQTSIPGIFACGNLIYGIDALKKNDIDGLEAGKAVNNYLKSL